MCGIDLINMLQCIKNKDRTKKFDADEKLQKIN